MPSFPLTLTLLDDVVITRSGRTEGIHETLHYIPGSNLLGALAAVFYDELQRDDPVSSFLLFHSGAVRFEDAVPLDEGDLPAWPCPLSWVRRKRGDGNDMRDLASAAVELADPFGDGTQSDGIGERLFTTGGRLCDVSRNRTVKSAVDPDGYERTRDGALFAYESLRAGQRFAAALSCEEEQARLAKRAWERLLELETLHVGRSRSAQFGRVRVEMREQEAGVPVHRPLDGARQVSIHLLSDTALHDPATGFPTLTPDPQFFGLPPRFAWRPERSAMRERRYSTFNGKRRLPDLQREVLQRGSVVVFHSEEPLSSEEAEGVVKSNAGGIGDYCQEGLGRIVVSPAYLGEMADPMASLQESVPTPSDQDKALVPEDALFAFLKVRARAFDIVDEASRRADRWLMELGEQYRLIRNETGRLEGPSASQWSLIREKAIAAGDDLTRLVSETVEDGGLCRKGVSRGAWDSNALVKLEGQIERRSFRDLLAGWLTISAKCEDPDREREVIMRAVALVAARVGSLRVHESGMGVSS